jgi:hypothetical protein
MSLAAGAVAHPEEICSLYATKTDRWHLTSFDELAVPGLEEVVLAGSLTADQ